MDTLDIPASLPESMFFLLVDETGLVISTVRSNCAQPDGVLVNEALFEQARSTSQPLRYSSGSLQTVAQPASLSASLNQSLSDWRVGLLLWGRLDEITNKVVALVASPDVATARLGRMAHERLEYANTVSRAQLLALKDAFGFSTTDVDESLSRAAQVAKGDLSGVWPLP